MDHFDPLQAVLRQVFTPYCRLLISTAYVVVSCVGCLGVTGLMRSSFRCGISFELWDVAE